MSQSVCGIMRVTIINKLRINTIKTCRTLSLVSRCLKDNNTNRIREIEDNVISESVTSISGSDCYLSICEDNGIQQVSKEKGTGKIINSKKMCNSESDTNPNINKSIHNIMYTHQRNGYVKQNRKVINVTKRHFSNSSPQKSNQDIANELQDDTSHVKGHQRFNQQRNKLPEINFEEYISHEECCEGLKSGELLQGVLNINPKKHQDGYLRVGTSERDIYIDGVEMRNRALSDDIVAVKLLPKDQWKMDTRKDLEDSYYFKTGKVVHIIERKHSRVTYGYLSVYRNYSFGFALLSPVDHCVPRLMIPIHELPNDFKTRPQDFRQTLFVARIVNWGLHMPFASGRLMRHLGEAGDVEPGTEAIMLSRNIDSSEFQNDVLSCLPDGDTWEITNEELMKRKDLRNECIFSIDPSTARDLDDALSCKKIGEDLYEVGVHIADVSHFIEENNALDKVAKERGTSVYLPHRVIPMLPNVLCEQLCSLNPGVERLAYSVMWNLKSDGTIVSEWFGRTVIKSCVKLSYDHAQQMIESLPADIIREEEYPPVDGNYTLEEISKIVKQLYTVSTHLRKERFDSGALKIDTPDLKFSLDEESGLPNGCGVYEYKNSNEMIEEFMLLANMAVARKIYRDHPKNAILRCHPPPKERMMEKVLDRCQAFDIPFDIKDSASINASFDNIVESHPTSYEYIYAALQFMCIKCIQNAQYFCTGTIVDEEFHHHYGLNVPIYTHFTSPIRRYPDIMVHRLLTASLDSSYMVNDDVKQLQIIADHCNEKRWAAEKASQESSLLFFAIYVKECGPIRQKGVVVGFTNSGIEVLSLISGIVHHVLTRDLSVSSHDFTWDDEPKITLYWTYTKTLDERLTALTKHFSKSQNQNKNNENGIEMCEENDENENDESRDESLIIKQELTSFSPVDVTLSVNESAPMKIIATLTNPHHINKNPEHGF